MLGVLIVPAQFERDENKKGLQSVKVKRVSISTFDPVEFSSISDRIDISTIMVNFILYELASGYALFEKLEFEEIGVETAQVQASLQDLAKFGKCMKLKSFLPFKNAADALQNCNDVSEGT